MISCVDSATNLANTNRTENPRGFTEVGENKLLLIAIVGISLFIRHILHKAPNPLYSLYLKFELRQFWLLSYSIHIQNYFV